MRHIILVVYALLLWLPLRGGVGTCAVDCALTQVGVLEESHNAGAQVEQYLASTTMPKGASWCAAFVHWSFRQCGTVLHPIRSYAWSPTWFIPAYRVQEPKPGDVFGIYYRSLDRVGHVGLVVEIKSGYLITVEGNTDPDQGSRDGDGVYLKRRLRANINHYSRIR